MCLKFFSNNNKHLDLVNIEQTASADTRVATLTEIIEL